MTDAKRHILTEMAKLADYADRHEENDLRNYLQMGILGSKLPQPVRRWLVGKGMTLLNTEMAKGRAQ